MIADRPCGVKVAKPVTRNKNITIKIIAGTNVAFSKFVLLILGKKNLRQMTSIIGGTSSNEKAFANRNALTLTISVR
ncbi:MAG: hypothetical protein IKC70_05180 [Bacteroidaceae bacterium]|nr:hypothetical protein [Bacteroidaceae bacterium]